MRKFLSFLFTLLIIGGIAFIIWKHPAFCQRQLDKVKAVWLVYKGDKDLKKLKIQRAINYYTNAVKLFPGHYGAWYNLGNIYVVYEDYYSAVDAYEQAFEHNPKMIVARMNYGIVSAEKLGDFDGAIDQYNDILNTKRTLITIPFVYSNRRSYKLNRGIAYYNRGVAYKQKSIFHGYDYDERKKYLFKALESYQEACKILKNDYDAKYNLALTYHIIGANKEAGLAYCDAIEIDPMKYEAHYNLAILLRRLKYYNESLNELEKASSLLTTGPNGVTAQQRYIFDLMSDVTRSILVSKDSALIEKLFEEDPEGETPPKITYINGRLVMSDKLDRAILKNLAVCEARKIIEENFEDADKDLFDVLYDIHVPKNVDRKTKVNVPKEEEGLSEEKVSDDKEIQQDTDTPQEDENLFDSNVPDVNLQDFNNTDNENNSFDTNLPKTEEN